MITSFYAAILGLFLVVLSVNVIKARRKFGTALGDANKIEMKRRIRAQANLAEYAPIFLILLGYAESNGLWGWVLHLLGVIFLVGRIMHANSLLRAELYDGDILTTNPVWRILGMSCTFGVIGFLSVILLIQGVLSFCKLV